MMFSKSFGYSLRSVLYVAVTSENGGRVPLSEIAERLEIPRHYLGKVMKRLVKEGILNSQKGPAGGFNTSDRTMDTTLLSFFNMTGESEQFYTCVLRLQKCNAKNPCPLHSRAESLREQWRLLLSSTTVGDLVKKGQPDFILSLVSI